MYEWKGGSSGQSFVGVWDGLRVGSVLCMFMQWKFVVCIFYPGGAGGGRVLRSQEWMRGRSRGRLVIIDKNRGSGENVKKGRWGERERGKESV